MPLISPEPSSSTEADRTQSLKRKAQETIQALKTMSNSGPKRSKPDFNNFLKQYKENLCTYEVNSWATNLISPKELAQRGWKALFRDPNERKSCIECTTCGRKMSPEVPDPKKHDEEMNLRFLKTVKKDLAEKHSFTCIFRSIKITFHDLCCDSSCFEANMDELLHGYKDKLKLQPKVVGFIHKFIEEEGQIDGNTLPNKILAALLWEARLTPWGTCSLYCSLCDRNCVILKNNEDFDPVASHRYYCPIFDPVCEKTLLWHERIRSLLTTKKHKEIAPQLTASSLALRASKLLNNALSVVVKS